MDKILWHMNMNILSIKRRGVLKISQDWSNTLQYSSVGLKYYEYIIVFLIHVKLNCGLVKSCNLSDDRILNYLVVIIYNIFSNCK